MDFIYYLKLIIVITKYRNKKIQDKRENKNKIPLELRLNQRELNFANFVEQFKKHIIKDYQLKNLTVNWEDVDWVKGLNDIYEVYCFIRFRNFLKDNGVVFYDNLNSNVIYDDNKHTIVKYENDKSR